VILFLYAYHSTCSVVVLEGLAIHTYTFDVIMVFLAEKLPYIRSYIVTYGVYIRSSMVHTYGQVWCIHTVMYGVYIRSWPIANPSYKHTYIHTLIYTHIHTHTHTYTHTDTHTDTHTRIQTHTRTHTHTHVHTHAYTHVHTH